MNTVKAEALQTSAPRLRLNGWAAFTVSAALLIAALIFQVAVPFHNIPETGMTTLDTVEGFVDGIGFLSFTFVGALLMKKENPLGRLYLVPGLSYSLGFVAMMYSVYGVLIRPLPGAVVLALMGNITFVFSIGTVLILIPLAYPSGEATGKLWRWCYRLGVAAILLISLVLLVTPGPANEPMIMAGNPLGIEAGGEFLGLLAGLGLIMLLGLILVSVVSVILRIRKSEEDLRKALRYLLIGEMILVFVYLSDSFIQPVLPIWGPVAPLIAIPAIPFMTYLALLRNR